MLTLLCVRIGTCGPTYLTHIYVYAYVYEYVCTCMCVRVCVYCTYGFVHRDTYRMSVYTHVYVYVLMSLYSCSHANANVGT